MTSASHASPAPGPDAGRGTGHDAGLGVGDGAGRAVRWPLVAGVLFAVALAVAFAVGFSDPAQVAQVLVAAAFVYLGSAALGRRSAAWPLFGLTFVLIGIGFAVPGFDPFWAMLAVVVVLAVYGLARGEIRPAWGMPLQVAAMVAAVAVALAVAAVGQPWAGLLVGVGLLGHAAWDVHHLRTRRVVAPTLAEFCGALDAVLGVAVIVLSLAG
ncbi:hypothetical protein ACFWH7_03920 [Cellulosimicrobium cellulans]|uniref:hypothetical protein n=1 Tax=Cellulosimicrobium cellulans TaxID=1710 RepID=UPI00365621F4